MRNAIKLMFAASTATFGFVAAAQVQPIPQQQLEKGFLGDQNARLSSQDAPTDAHYTIRAAAALSRNDFARALAILRPYRLSQDFEYHYLSGRAHEGLGDFAAARKELGTALKRRKNHIPAQLALGLLEARHGEPGQAARVLASLKQRQAECGGECRDAAELAAAVGAIEAALAGGRN